MLILKDEHAIDVLNSGNIGHLWHDFHAIDVHATDVGDPDDDDSGDEDVEDGTEMHDLSGEPRAAKLSTNCFQLTF